MSGGEAIGSLLAGTGVLLVGVEEHPDGGIKGYINNRADGLYVHVTDPDAAQRFQDEWKARGGHIVIPKPLPHQVWEDEPAAVVAGV